MATSIKKFDSSGGFSVNETVIITEYNQISNAHSIELKNSNFSDCSRKTYLLRGTESSILSLNGINERIILPSESLNFVTANIIAINNGSTGTYSVKKETVIKCDENGLSTILSSLTTIIRDSIPTTDVWTIQEYLEGSANEFSFITTRSGSSGVPSLVKWAVVTDVQSITL